MYLDVGKCAKRMCCPLNLSYPLNHTIKSRKGANIKSNISTLLQETNLRIYKNHCEIKTIKLVQLMIEWVEKKEKGTTMETKET